MRKGGVCFFLFLASIGWTEGGAPQLAFRDLPRVSDRTVEWSWDAVPSDPNFTGNSTLKRSGRIGSSPIHDREVAAILLDITGTVGFSLTEDGTQVFRWDLATGGILDTLASVPGPVRILKASIHEDLLAMAAALEDGRVALWDLARTDTLWVFQAHNGPCNDIAHFPGVSANRFVTAGGDGAIREWSVRLEPGMPTPQPVREFLFPSGEVRSVDLDLRREILAGGSSGGQVRLWDLTRPGVFLRNILNLGNQPVTDVDLGFSRKFLVTVDQQLGLTIWDLALSDPVPLAQIPVGAGRTATVALTPPDDLLLLVSYDDGSLEVREAETGQVFRRDTEGSPVSALAPHPDGGRIILGRGDGDLILWSAGFCRPSPADPVCFGGYRVWRGLSPNREAMILLRTYSYGDSSWTFARTDSLRYFIDPDSVSRRGADPEFDIAGPHNGFPYYYSITRFDKVYSAGSVFEVYVCDDPDKERCVEQGIFRDQGTGEPLGIIPRRSPRTDPPILGEVWVVPNPYERGRVAWDPYTFPHVRFVNLPGAAEIKIFTVAGDLVRILEHSADELGQGSGEEDWDLTNGAGETVASGVYIYAVKTPDGKISRGYLTLIL